LGEVALEQVGQSWTVVIGDKRRGRSLQQRRTLQIKTTAEGPMAVLRILDVGKHLLPRQQAQLQRSLAAASKNSDSNSSLASSSNHGSSASFAGMSQAADVSRTLPVLSRTNSNSSIIAGSANSMEQQPEQAPRPSSAEAARGGDVRGPAARHHINAKHHMLQRLAAFLSGSSSSNTSSNAYATSSMVVPPSAELAATAAALQLSDPVLDLQVQLQGLGLSLVSDSRELLYGCCLGVRGRFCQDPVRNALGVTLSSIRFENTLYGCQHPLLLASPVSRSVFGVIYPIQLQQGLPSFDAGEADVCGRFSNAGEARPERIAALQEGRTGQQQQDAEQAVPNALAPAMPGMNAAAPRGSSGQPHLHTQPRHPDPKHHPDTQLLPHHIALGVLATVWRSKPSGVVCVEQLSVQVSPVALSLEGKHLKQLVEFASTVSEATTGMANSSSCSGTLTGQHTDWTLSGAPAGRGAAGLANIASSSSRGGWAESAAGRLLPVAPPSLPPVGTVTESLKLYFQQCHISAITLCISFAPGSWFDPLPGGTAAPARGDISPSSPVSAAAHAGGSTGPAPGAVEALAAAAAAASSRVAPAAGGLPYDSSAVEEAFPWTHSSAAAEAAAHAAAEAAAAVAPEGSSSAAAGGAVLPVWLQMALALAHAEEGAWLTLSAFSSNHAVINTDAMVQVRVRVVCGV
jgi:hypothetical protein